jgi:hypothetical protein
MYRGSPTLVLRGVPARLFQRRHHRRQPQPPQPPRQPPPQPQPRLEAGVPIANSGRATVRDLYVQTRRQREVLVAALRLELE